MHDGMPYGRIQGQGQGHSREVDRQSPTGLIFCDNFGKSGPIFTLFSLLNSQRICGGSYEEARFSSDM